MKFLSEPRSGSRGSETFSRNQFGQYVRARTPPTQPSSVYADQKRVNMADAVAAWQALTSDQRRMWEAESRDRHDSLGQSFLRSGRGLFVSRWLVRVNSGLAPLVDPLPVVPFVLRSVSVSSTLSVTAVSIAATRVDIYALQPVSPAVERPPGRYWWLYMVGSDISAGTTVTPSFSGTYSARFGALPLAGQRLWVQVREVSPAGDHGPVLRALVDF